MFKKTLLRNIYFALFVIIVGLIVQANQSLFSGSKRDGILLIFAIASIPLGISFLVYQAWKIGTNPTYLLFDLEAKVLKMPKAQDLSFNALSSCLLRYESGRYDLDIIYKNGKILTTAKCTYLVWIVFKWNKLLRSSTSLSLKQRKVKPLSYHHAFNSYLPFS
ncbi:hypothetical protein [Alteromonas sp. W364]|uniref:hypothetical protein n=1 Tax=Alteromonas sp. W364 TaxID=3075610 RepID=UPI0028854EE1|nr:hypothetical protein [Alteromonas sp. W364]MDT0629161.1 hypothetical protein [Alteromonas sp. W364]